MSRGLSHAEYLVRLKKEHQSNIIPLERYIDMKTPIKHKCLKHDYIWKVTPASLLAGRGCTKCGIEKRRKINRKSHDEYLRDLKKVHGDNITPLEAYYNTDTKIKHKCEVCGYIWEPRPANLLKGKGCPNCAGNVKRTHQDYVEDLKKIHGDDIVPIEKYDWVHVKIKHKCNVCGHEWEARPHNILQHKGCPKCRLSQGEKEIDSYLAELGVDYISQYKFSDCSDKRPLPFDFSIKRNENIIGLIEYQGRQHYMNVEAFDGKEGYKSTIKHDIIKSEFVDKNNIPLLRVNFLDKKYDNLVDKIDLFLVSIYHDKDKLSERWGRELLMER